MIKKYLVITLLLSLAIADIGLLNLMGFGYRNTNFLINDDKLIELRNSNSTKYSINLSNYFYKNLFKNGSGYNDIALQHAGIEIDLFNQKKFMLGIKPLFTSNFSTENSKKLQHYLPGPQIINYSKMFTLSGDISDYYIGFWSKYNTFKYGLVFYYEFGMQTILSEVFTYPSESSINLGSRKLFEREYSSSRINFFYEHIFNLKSKGLFLLSLHQPVRLNQKEYELLTNQNGNLLAEYDSKSSPFIDQLMFNYQYFLTSDKKLSLSLNRLNSFKVENLNFDVLKINYSDFQGISGYDVSSIDIDFYLNKKIGSLSNNNIIIGLGSNYSKIKFEDVNLDEFSIKIKLGLSTSLNSMIFNFNYGNRYNNFFVIEEERFFKISIDLALGDIYYIK